MAAAVALCFHNKLKQSASQMKVKRSSINGTVSSHVFPDTITLSDLTSFQRIASSERCSENSFIGTVSGNLILSVDPSRSVSESKKRKASTAADDAQSAVSRLRRSGNKSERISNASYDVAISTLTSLLELKGTSGELIIESWAISIREHGQYGAAQTPNKEPSLVIALRISAGAAVPAHSLVSALHSLKDGMITIAQEQVNQDFDLPLTEEGKEAHEHGQRSILLLASVPHMDDPPAAAPGS
jgi:hypothetical protein